MIAVEGHIQAPVLSTSPGPSPAPPAPYLCSTSFSIEEPMCKRGSIAWLKQEVAFLTARRDLLFKYTDAALKVRASIDDQLARAHSEVSDAALKKAAATFKMKEAGTILTDSEKKALANLKSVTWGVPARAALIETFENVIVDRSQIQETAKGIKLVKSATVNVKLQHSYISNTVAVSWASQTSQSTIRKLPHNANSKATNSVAVQVEEPTEQELLGTRLHTIVYQSSSTHPKFKSILQAIMTSNANSGSLEKNIQDLFSQCGLTVNDSDEEGQTLLHAACYAGNEDLAKWLLQHGANIESMDCHGWTPLLTALASLYPRSCSTAAFLLRKNASCKVSSQSGNTPLHYLCRCPHNYAQNPIFVQLFDRLVKDCDINDRGDTPLICAARAGNVVACSKLCKLVDDINYADAYGYTALHYGVTLGLPQLVEMLLEANANPDVITKMKTPRLLSASCGNIEIAGLFGKRGTQISVLSDSLFKRILGYLPPLDVYRVRRVNKKFKALCWALQDDAQYWESIGANKERFLYHETTFARIIRDCKNWQLLGPKPSPDFTLKIVVIGNTGVGRRSFVRAFAPPTSNQIEWSDGQGTGIVKRTTVVNFKKKTVSVAVHALLSNNPAESLVYNTGFFQGTHGVIYAFDTTDEVSLRDLIQWINESRRYIQSLLPPIVVMGTKADMIKARKVPISEGAKFACSLKSPYVEVSAKTGANVQLVLQVLADEIFQRLQRGEKDTLDSLASAQTVKVMPKSQQFTPGNKQARPSVGAAKYGINRPRTVSQHRLVHHQAIQQQQQQSKQPGIQLQGMQDCANM